MAETTVPVNSVTNIMHGQTTLGANNDFITINVGDSVDFVGVQINAGLTGTISYTASVDGTTFSAISGANADATAAATSDTSFGKIKVFDVRPITFLKLQITAFTSGSSLVIWDVNRITK